MSQLSSCPPHANVLHLLSFPVDISSVLPLPRPKPHSHPGCFFLPLPHPVCQEILLVLFSKQTENLTIFTTSIAAALVQATIPSHLGYRIHLLHGVLVSTLTAKSSFGNVSQIMGHLFSKALVSPLLSRKAKFWSPSLIPSPLLLLLIILLLWPQKLFSQVTEWVTPHFCLI